MYIVMMYTEQNKEKLIFFNISSIIRVLKFLIGITGILRFQVQGIYSS